MTLLALKLTITPILIGVVTLAARRWGPKLGGLLTGLPLTSGPVLVFVALDQGVGFADAMALGILSGLGAVGLFSVTYALAAQRGSWPACSVISVVIFFASIAALRPLPLGSMTAAAATLGLLVLIRAIFPRPGSNVAARKPPAWDLPGRAITATGIVLLLTAVAPTLGPRLSGLLTPFPAFALVLAAFTQAHEGAGAAILFLRGIVLASFASAAFFVTVAASLPHTGLLPTLSLAAVVALAVAALMHRLDRAKR
jgi:hypothetical protein